VCFPDYSDDASLANDIGHFFYKKVINIRKELDAAVIDQCDSARLINDPKFGFNQSLEKFEVLSTDMVSQLIQKSAKKSCSLDPMPTSLVVKSLNELLPVITCMINSSLSLGYFPSAWKSTLVDPRLKKTGQPASLSNLRPISNLQFVSKLTERAVSDQMFRYIPNPTISISSCSLYGNSLTKST
jgi:hypothetical protein